LEFGNPLQAIQRRKTGQDYGINGHRNKIRQDIISFFECLTKIYYTYFAIRARLSSFFLAFSHFSHSSLSSEKYEHSSQRARFYFLNLMLSIVKVAFELEVGV
jgi:hypothetical protein